MAPAPPESRDHSASERQEEFVRLLTRHGPYVRALILSLVPVWQDAEEILQETSLVAWRKFDTFELGTNFQAWLGRIATFEVHNFRGRTGKVRLKFDSELLEMLVEAHQANTAFQEAQWAALLKCLEKLPVADRELMIERYCAERQGKQIAEAQGRPADTVYKSLKRIRLALYRCINRKLAQEGDE
jgi:RNA polymerase sigma-70 factor (ECF subfamily)